MEQKGDVKLTAIYSSRDGSHEAFLMDVKIGKYEPLQNVKSYLEYYYLPVPHSLRELKPGEKVYLVLGDYQQPLGVYENLNEVSKFHSTEGTNILACTVSPNAQELVWM